jgi:hypothetical protein
MNKVAVYGGLGNQMFQYAFCTACNEKGKKTQLSFLCYLYYKHHTGFDLARAFKLDLPVHKKLLVFFMEYGALLYRNKIGAAVLRRVIGRYEKRQHWYQEKNEFKFDSNVFEQENSFFYGTWQSIKYFETIEEKIKKQFEFNTPLDEKNLHVAEKIRKTNSVSIHVRRGDYLNDHWQKQLGIIKDNSYYIQAAAYIESKISNPNYFIFSDDMNWVKKNISLQNCTYVDFNHGKKSYADMYLMANCKYNIIANSTFSWWAAWLNKFEDKIVLMPEKWMNTKNCEELYPASWIKIKT